MRIYFCGLLQRTDIRGAIPCCVMRVMETFVKLYFSLFPTNEEILHLFVPQQAKDNHIIISIRTTKRI